MALWMDIWEAGRFRIMKQYWRLFWSLGHVDTLSGQHKRKTHLLARGVLFPCSDLLSDVSEMLAWDASNEVVFNYLV